MFHSSLRSLYQHCFGKWLGDNLAPSHCRRNDDLVSGIFYHITSDNGLIFWLIPDERRKEEPYIMCDLLIEQPLCQADPMTHCQYVNGEWEGRIHLTLLGWLETTHLNEVKQKDETLLLSKWLLIWLKIMLFGVNSLRLRHNGLHFTDATFKRFFLNENVWISIKISLNFVPKCPMNNIPVLIQIMAGRRPGHKPLSEPMMVRLLTHICVTQPQLVKHASYWFIYIFHSFIH